MEVLFTHNVLHNNVEGILHVTGQRLSFVTGDVPTVQLSWADIIKDQYSPSSDARVMIRLTTRVTKQPLVFNFVGESGVCFTEQRTLKAILGKFIEKKSSDKKSSKRKDEAQSNNNSNELRTKRSRLLENDSSLRKEYKEYVVDMELMSDEEFWSSHATAVQAAEGQTSLRQGMLSSLFSDVQDVQYENGEMKICIDAEKISHIFLQYPLVKEAYTQLVPLEMSESEFWIKYFKSEYFVRDKSTSAIGGLNSGSAGGGIQRTDDMFSKFEKKNPPLKDSSVLMSRVDLDHSDVDLSSSAADVYKHTGTYCVSTVQCESDDVSLLSEAVGANKGLDNAKDAEIVKKYNRSSVIILEQTIGIAQKGDGKVVPSAGSTSTAQKQKSLKKLRQVDDVELLNFPKDPGYLPLHNRSASSLMHTDNISTGHSHAGNGEQAHKMNLSNGSHNQYRYAYPTGEQAYRFIRTENTLLLDQRERIFGPAKASSAKLPALFVELKIVKEWEDVKDKYTGKEKEKDANQKIQLTKGKINKIFTKLDEIVVILRDKKSQLYAATTSGKSLQPLFFCMQHVSDLITRGESVWDMHQDKQNANSYTAFA